MSATATASLRRGIPPRPIVRCADDGQAASRPSVLSDSYYFCTPTHLNPCELHTLKHAERLPTLKLQSTASLRPPSSLVVHLPMSDQNCQICKKVPPIHDKCNRTFKNVHIMIPRGSGRNIFKSQEKWDEARGGLCCFMTVVSMHAGKVLCIPYWLTSLRIKRKTRKP